MLSVFSGESRGEVVCVKRCIVLSGIVSQK